MFKCKELLNILNEWRHSRGGGVFTYYLNMDDFEGDGEKTFIYFAKQVGETGNEIEAEVEYTYDSDGINLDGIYIYLRNDRKLEISDNIKESTIEDIYDKIGKDIY